jgi:hypothetical protein
MRHASCRAGLAVLALLCSSSAHAQWSGRATAGFGRGLGAISLSQGNLSLGRNALRERAARRSNGSAAASQREVALTYTPDPKVTEKIRVSMIDLASATNPESRPKWEKVMADDAMLRDFDQVMAAHGYSRLNFADDVATLLAYCWEVANGREASEAQIRGAHDQIRRVARTDPKLRGLPNAERQALAESIAYQVLFMRAAQLAAERSGSQPQLAELRASATKAASQYGVDVSRMALTEKGFKRQ